MTSLSGRFRTCRLLRPTGKWHEERLRVGVLAVICVMAADVQCLPPRFRFSYRVATLIVCCFNILAAIYLLQSFIRPFIANASSPFAVGDLRSNRVSSTAARYTPKQLERMKEAIRIRRVAEPVDLINRVKDIQNESSGVYGLEVTMAEKQPQTVGLVERLKEIRSSKTKSDQEALEEWRRKKLEEARRRSQAMKAKQEEYIT